MALVLCIVGCGASREEGDEAPPAANESRTSSLGDVLVASHDGESSEPVLFAQRTSLAADLEQFSTNSLAGGSEDPVDPAEAPDVGQARQGWSAAIHAFLWAERPNWIDDPLSEDGNVGYSTDARYSYNQYGQPNIVFQDGTGKYLVLLPGYADPFNPNESTHHVQVVAYGENNVRCKIRSHGSEGDIRMYRVNCHKPNGTLTNSQFVLQYDCPTHWSGPPSGYTASCDDLTADSCNPSVQWHSAQRTAGFIKVTRSGVGRYLVDFPGITEIKGNVQVTAMFGNNANHCVANLQSQNGARLRVGVACNDRNGRAVDSHYVVKYDNGITSRTGVGGYVTATRFTTPDYVPIAQTTHNVDQYGVTRPANRVGRFGKGHYWAIHPGQTALNSSVHVTGFSTDGYCKVRKWFKQGNDVLVETFCFDHAGEPIDMAYSEMYMWPLFTPH